MTDALQLRQAEAPDEAAPPSLPRAIWAAVSTDEVAGRVLVTAAVALAVGGLGITAAVSAVVVVQILDEALKAALERLQLSKRKKWLLTLLLLLLQFPQHAFAAVRHVLGRRERDNPSSLSGWSASAVTSVAAVLLAVTLVTAPELALGRSLVDDRRTTFFSPARAGPSLRLPGPHEVEATTGSGATVTYAVRSRGTVRCTPQSRSVFPVGTTEVKCTARFGRSVARGSFTVTVLDSTAPKLAVPRDVARAIAADSHRIEYDGVAASDAVDSRPTVSCSPPSGSRFRLGETRVACTATDASGNRAEEGFVVRLTRAIENAAVLTLPAARTAEAAGARGAVVTYRAAASDSSGRPLSVACRPRSGSVFSLGTTRVRCRTVGRDGAAAAGRFDVVVTDRTPPELALPSRIERTTTGSDVVVPYAAEARDLVDPAPGLDCRPAPGSAFRVGEHTVGCTAVDRAGNMAVRSFVVAVRRAAPTISVPSDVLVEATGPRGAAGNFQVTAAFGGRALPVMCRPSSGSRFPIGTSTVTCEATAPDGRTASERFDVTVRDTARPDVVLPGSFRVEATTRDGALVQWQKRATDLVTATPKLDCTHEPGSLLPVGETTVSCTARDDAGNTAARGFTVTVYDAEPTIETPEDVTVGYATPRSTPVAYVLPAAHDRIDGGLRPTCAPAPGSSFRLGATTVRCSATDSRGQKAEASFTITVVDRVTPRLSLPRTGNGGRLVVAVPYNWKEPTYPVKYVARADDDVDGRLEPICKPPSGSEFAVDQRTLVTCSATDGAGNVATGSFWVSFYEAPG